MQLLPEIQDLIISNPNGFGYVPVPNISKENLEILKNINKEYKSTYGKDMIILKQDL